MSKKESIKQKVNRKKVEEEKTPLDDIEDQKPGFPDIDIKKNLGCG